MKNKVLYVLLPILLLFITVLPTFITSNHVNAAPADAYWVGGTGSWSDATNHWANVSGGTPWSTNLPDSTTNVHFDVNSFTLGSQTVTVDATAYCKDMDWTGALNTPTLTFNNHIHTYGNITFISAMVITTGGYALWGNAIGVVNFTTNSLTINVNTVMQGAGGWVFQDNANFSNKILRLQQGTIDTNGNTVTCGSFEDAGSASVNTLILGSSTVNCTAWVFTGAALTLTANTSTIKISGTGAFSGNSKTYYNVELNGTAHTISGNNTFNTLSLPSGTTQTITFTDGTTSNSSSFNLNGSAGHVHTLKGTDALGWTLNKTTAGKVFADYVALNWSIGTPANTFYYGYNSTAVNTTGWNQGQFTLTYTNGSHGNLTGTTPQIVWIGGNGTAVTAVPDACYHFVNWSDSSTQNPRTDTNISTNVSVTANFAINVSTVTYTAGTGGTVNGSWPQYVDCGGDGPWVLAIPDPCYHFVSWNDSSTNNPRHETNVVTNLSYSASFALNTSVITYLAGSGGTIVGDTPQTVNCGDYTTSVTALPNTCYHFVNWSDGNVSDTRSDLGTSTNQTFTANFELTYYWLNYSADANGYLIGNVSQYVECGLDGTSITAMPNSCYHFVNWSDSSTQNPRTDTNVAANVSVTANFAINVYTLNYVAGANGTLLGSLSQTVNCGGDGTPVTPLSDPCYYFIGWNDSTYSNPRTDTNVMSNISVEANFGIINYSLVASANNGSAIPSGTYYCGQVVNLVATPSNISCVFVNWSGDTGTIANISNASTTITMSGNYSVIANFNYVTYILNYTTSYGGYIAGLTPQTVGLHTNGSSVMAVPITCYSFVNWSDGVLTTLRTDTDVVSNLNVQANFVINNYTLAYTAGPNGSLVGDGLQVVNCGANGSTVVAVPDPTFHFSGWSDGNMNSSRMDVNVSSNITVTANFESNSSTYTLYLYTNQSSIQPYFIGANPFAYGTTVQIFANTSAGYAFDYWAPSDGILNPNAEIATINMTRDRYITAYYHSIEGYSVVSAIYWGIGILVAVFLTVLAFWQKKMWLFVLAGLVWWIMGIFSMIYYTAYTLGWSLGFAYLAIGLVCMLATMWLHEKRDAPLESPQDQGWHEMKERIQERKNKRGDL